VARRETGGQAHGVGRAAQAGWAAAAGTAWELILLGLIGLCLAGLCLVGLCLAGLCLAGLCLAGLCLVPGRRPGRWGTEALDVWPRRRGGVKIDGQVVPRDEVSPDRLVAAGLPAAALAAARVQPGYSFPAGLWALTNSRLPVKMACASWSRVAT
jgi:hypothetical protein